MLQLVFSLLVSFVIHTGGLAEYRPPLVVGIPMSFDSSATPEDFYTGGTPEVYGVSHWFSAPSIEAPVLEVLLDEITAADRPVRAFGADLAWTEGFGPTPAVRVPDRFGPHEYVSWVGHIATGCDEGAPRQAEPWSGTIASFPLD